MHTISDPLAKVRWCCYPDGKMEIAGYGYQADLGGKGYWRLGRFKERL